MAFFAQRYSAATRLRFQTCYPSVVLHSRRKVNSADRMGNAFDDPLLLIIADEARLSDKFVDFSFVMMQLSSSGR